MILYTCGQEKRHASIGHACGRAAKALDQAGYEYEIKAMPGYRRGALDLAQAPPRPR